MQFPVTGAVTNSHRAIANVEEDYLVVAVPESVGFHVGEDVVADRLEKDDVGVHADAILELPQNR